MLEEGPGRLESASEVSASAMRLKLEVEEKKQALALLQRALVRPPPGTAPLLCTTTCLCPLTAHHHGALSAFVLRHQLECGPQCLP